MRVQVESPVTQNTANGRLRGCIAAYPRLRPKVDINPTFLHDAYVFLRSKKMVKRFSLKPSREKDKSWATYQNFLDLASAMLLKCPEAPFSARGRLQFLAYTSLLMFSVGRPSEIALAQNYHLPEHALQYKSLQYCYRAGPDGKVRLGLTIMLENRKGYKNSQDDWVEVTMMSRPHMPLATDTVQLFAIMSIEDEVFEDVTSLEQLSGNGLTLDDLDPVTGKRSVST